MNDSVINYALECTPAQEQARLTKIVVALTEDEVGGSSAVLTATAMTVQALQAGQPITPWWALSGR